MPFPYHFLTVVATSGPQFFISRCVWFVFHTNFTISSWIDQNWIFIARLLFTLQILLGLRSSHLRLRLNQFTVYFVCLEWCWFQAMFHFEWLRASSWCERRKHATQVCVHVSYFTLLRPHLSCFIFLHFCSFGEDTWCMSYVFYCLQCGSRSSARLRWCLCHIRSSQLQKYPYLYQNTQ